MLSIERIPKIRRFLLFDACMSHLERCQIDKSCKANENIFCIHRLGFDSEVIYANNQYIGFLRFSDLQILFHFLYQIAEYREYGRLAHKCSFYIVTRDLRFLKAIQTEWLSKTRSGSLKLEFSREKIKASFKLRNDHTVEVAIIALPTKNRSSRDSIEELMTRLEP